MARTSCSLRPACFLLASYSCSESNEFRTRLRSRSMSASDGRGERETSASVRTIHWSMRRSRTRVSDSFAIEELLVAAKGADIAQQDDVVFDPCDDEIHNFLRRKPSRRGSNGGRKKHSASKKARHQKVDPRLKKI